MRERILERRRKFLGTTIALIGCTPTTRPPNVAEIPPSDAAVPTVTATAQDPVPDAAPDVKKSTPGRSITIPDGISEATRTRYERLDQSVTSFNQGIAKASQEIASAPKCPGIACDEFWIKMAGAIADHSQQIFWFGYYCPQKNDETDAFLAELKNQQSIARDAAAKVREQAIKKLGSESLLQKYSTQYDMANPRPCLSVACDHW